MILHNILVELIQINCYCVALLHMPVVVGYWLWKRKKTEIIKVFSCSHFVYATDLTCYTCIALLFSVNQPG